MGKMVLAFYFNTFLKSFLLLFIYLLLSTEESQPANKLFLFLSPSLHLSAILLSTHSETVGDWIEAQQLGRKRLPPTHTHPDALLFYHPTRVFIENLFTLLWAGEMYNVRVSR
jgi:hypothetical protein